MTTEYSLVTGAERGIGAAIAHKLAAAGHFVLVNHRGTGELAEQVVASIRERGGQARSLRFDVCKPDSIAQALAEAKVEKLRVLVNNAGILRDNLLVATPSADFRSVLATNFAGMVETFRVCRPLLRAGCVVNMSSISGLRGGRGQCSYASSKALVWAWTAELARQYGASGMRFYCVSPGPVATDMVKSSPIYQRSEAHKAIPVQRFGEPDEIADLVVRLSDAKSDLWNGCNWVVDGGFTLSMKS